MSESKWTLDKIEELYRKFRPDTVNNYGKTVGIGDSDDHARVFLRTQLLKRGFSVWSADSSLATLKMIKNHKPDCCILDINLFPVSGIDILETLSRDEEFKKTLVLITGNALNREDCAIARIYGAASIMKKPIQGGAIADEINKHLKSRAN